MSADIAIEVNDLQKTYKTGFFRRREVEALKGVSFKVDEGEIFGLLGPNGAGKTTMVKVLLGLVHKTGGDAALLGCDAGDIKARRKVGYLPEHHQIPRHHSVNSALEYYGSLSGMSMSDIETKRPAMLETVGLQDWGEASVKTLSKGMLQRLGLAQAMLHEPKLLILDEPTDGVDPVGRAEMREVLQGLAENGTTIFLNSHLLQEIELVCTKIVILDKGKMRWEGSVDDVTQFKASEIVTMELIGKKPDVMGCVDPECGPKLTAGSKGRIKLQVKLPNQDAVDQLIDSLRQKEISLVSMTRQRQTLEEAFLSILKE